MKYFGLIYDLYNKYKFVTLILTMGIIAALSYGFLGEFLDSSLFSWLKSELNRTPLLSELISAQSMVVDALIASTLPLFIVWGIAFAGYAEFNEYVDSINKISRYFSFFTGGPSRIVFYLSSVLIGLCVYGWKNYTFSISLVVASILSIVLICMAIFVRSGSSPELKRSDFLDRYAPIFSIICIVFAILVWFWNMFSETIQLVWAIHSVAGNT